VYLEILESELARFRLVRPAAEKELLARYCDELVRWNAKINLTALKGADMVRRLVVEPVWIAQELPFAGVLADIGSGNGSPALPFLAGGKFAQAHLVEARTKRAAFLRHVVSLLRLSRVTIHRGRFEEVAPAVSSSADWITLQAVALTEELMETIRGTSRHTTTVVWITSANTRSLLKPTRILEVPITGTRVFLFRLDLS
jgi:16S rRNA (guanine(527)-N(7))-methyltransferase RsmG